MTAALELDWSPLDPDALVSAPCLIEQTLCVANEGIPRRAKDFDYAKSILDSWREEESESEDTWEAEMSPISYSSTTDDRLYGHLIRNPSKSKSSVLPIVLFFHTGAGPHDLFLFWKAASLVQSVDCIVMVCDILGDDTGWAWHSNRSRYNQARSSVLQKDDLSACRPVLQDRITGAIQTVSRVDDLADARRLGAMGWCLGGHPVLELGRMNLQNMRAMATFHGVFDDIPPSAGTKEESVGTEILVCHGVNDPFVSDESISNALATFQKHGQRTSLLQLKAKHGFTNPAQEYNPNEAFEFCPESAKKAWRQTVALMKRALA